MGSSQDFRKLIPECSHLLFPSPHLLCVWDHSPIGTSNCIQPSDFRCSWVMTCFIWPQNFSLSVWSATNVSQSLGCCVWRRVFLLAQQLLSPQWCKRHGTVDTNAWISAAVNPLHTWFLLTTVTLCSSKRLFEQLNLGPIIVWKGSKWLVQPSSAVFQINVELFGVSRCIKFN